MINSCLKSRDPRSPNQPLRSKAAVVDSRAEHINRVIVSSSVISVIILIIVVVITNATGMT